METTKRFDNAIKALVKGYFEGTLAKDSCTACAVGNMVAYSMGYKILQRTVLGFKWITKGTNGYNSVYPNWNGVFCSGEGKQIIDPNRYVSIAKEEIDSTGYSWQELALVEKTFEENTDISLSSYYACSKGEQEADQYKGLMAVVDVLCEIEGIKDASAYKKIFDKV